MTATSSARVSTRPAGDQAEARANERDLVVGFSQFVMNHPYRIANVESIKRAARDAGVRLVVTDAGGSADVELANIARLIGRGVDAIIVSSLSGAAVYNAYEAVAAAGVPLIIFASGVPYEADIPYTCYVATDDVEIGRRAGEYVVRRMEGNGRLAILEGIRDSTNNRLRMDGLLPVLGAASGIVVAGMDSADWLRRPAQQAMSKMLASTWPIDAVLALNDEMALGALDALRGAHRDQDIFVVGLDGQKEALQEIRTGGPFVMTIRNEWDGAEALRVAIAAARGEQVARRITLDATLIDAHNVEALFDPSATC